MTEQQHSGNGCALPLSLCLKGRLWILIFLFIRVPSIYHRQYAGDITLQTKVCLVKAIVFPVVRHECESWTIKKAEHWKIDAFELWCWRRLLRVPWTAGTSNKSIIKDYQPWIFIGRTDAKAEAPILWPPDAKNWVPKEDSDAGKDWRWEEKGEGDDRGWEDCMTSRTWCTRVWASSGSWWWTGRPGMLQSMESQRVGHDCATELTDARYWTFTGDLGRYHSFHWRTYQYTIINCLMPLTRKKKKKCFLPS